MIQQLLYLGNSNSAAVETVSGGGLQTKWQILQKTILNEKLYILVQISLKFVCRVQLIASHHWFR